MSYAAFSLPLFPLSAHVLPGGRLSLRIFEPRYIRMVKQACSEQQGFGLCMLNTKGDKAQNTHIFPVGTYCEVVDFDMLDDGLLGITVAGLRRFSIDRISEESDGLRIGQCIWLDEWPEDIALAQLTPMDSKLAEVFAKYPDLQSLYQQPAFDQPLWVIYRWLEILPVDPAKKQQLLAQKDAEQALQFLMSLVE